ncbi:SPOR domain-containing protein [Sphingomonas flavalba]|uniref:SPOR domain-containing protein n=1 Tax=Sphingomonas flavalba TaxID=2559804 RepID=UPI001EF05B90|nr:SPOR domain-containing protein [Sphingomonas flavalba]
MTSGWARMMAVGGGLALLAGCAGHKGKPVPTPAPAPTPTPAPAPTHPTINSGIGAQEAVWHLRAALNVAALSCNDRGLADRYNRLLQDKRSALAAAYAAETARFSTAALDSHMTQVYNYFALPRDRAAFCAAAGEALAGAGTADLPGFAPAALERLEAPPALRHTATVAAARVAAVGSWQIQLGAYGKRANAEAAWRQVSNRLSGAARTPRYEAVPGKPLTRLRVGPVADRAEAVRLCAAAAGAGLDCMPIAS